MGVVDRAGEDETVGFTGLGNEGVDAVFITEDALAALRAGAALQTVGQRLAAGLDDLSFDAFGFEDPDHLFQGRHGGAMDMAGTVDE